jgi:capsular polysaccharide biosynthesis protein
MSNATDSGESASEVDRRSERRHQRRLEKRRNRLGGERDGSRASTDDWKVRFGRVTFYNTQFANRRLIKPPPIEDVPMSVEVVPDAFVSRRAVGTDSIDDDSHYISGAIYDRQGMILPTVLQEEQKRRGIVPRQNPDAADPARIAAAQKISGRCVYLGTLQTHFGHFILETMARAWYLVNLDPSARIILHSHRVEDAGRLKSYVQAVLNALSITPERVVLAHRDLLVDELAIPNPQFWLRSRGSMGFCLAFDHIREQLVRKGHSARDLPKRLYLTRRQFASVIERKLGRQGLRERKRTGLHRRMALNEEEAEALFAARGFHVVAPETLPLEQQIMLIGNASHIAGLSGSALHLALFNNNPNAKVIELCTRSTSTLNQLIVNGVRGLESHHIFCINDHDENHRPMLDMSVVRRVLDEIP